MTQRPTFSELKRVLFTLGAVMAVQVKPTAAAGGEGASEGAAAEGSQQQPSKQAVAGSSQTSTQSGVAGAAGAPGEEAPGATSRSVTPESLVVVPPVASPGSKKQVGHVQASDMLRAGCCVHASHSTRGRQWSLNSSRRWHSASRVAAARRPERLQHLCGCSTRIS